MKGKVIGALLVVLNLLLVGGLGFFHFRKDTEAPEIKVNQVDLVYENGMEETRLLEGITAYDKVDGDLTTQIIIEKIVTDEVKGSATITYGVVDNAGNISKTTRTVDMSVEKLLQENETEDVSMEEESVLVEETVEEEVSEEEGSEEEISDVEADSEEETSEEESAEEESVEEEAIEEVDDAGTETQQVAENESQTTVQNSVNKPSILFRDTKVKARVGESPAWVDAIEGLYDDVDNYAFLLGTIKVHGVFDRNTPGTYSVKVTITDSEGNESIAYPVDIVVQ